MPRICPHSSSAPRPLGAAYIPILLSEVEQEQRPSGNGDRVAIVVRAGLCDGEGGRAYTRYAPHIKRKISANVFSLRRFGIFFFAETSAAMFLPKRLLLKHPESRRAHRWNYPSALGGRQAINLGCYLCRSSCPHQNRKRVFCQPRHSSGGCGGNENG